MIYELKDLPKPLPHELLFDQKQALEIEIGTGKGTYISNLSQANPGTRFIGIEKSIKWFRMADEKSEKKKIPNLLLLHCYLDVFLHEYLGQELVQRFHILFPDPWPKRRHEHRRIFQPALIRDLWIGLKPGGSVFFGTDHQDYFRATKKMITTDFAHFFSFETVDSFEFQSNFQKKYEKEGRNLSFAVLTKIGGISTTPNLYAEILEAKKQDPARPPVEEND